MKGCLFTFIGPSGVGKSEILNEINKKHPEMLSRAVSITTREKRPDDKENGDYYFKTENEFLKLIDEGEFIEYNKYVGKYYGTSFSSIIPLLDNGKKVVKIIEVIGLKNIKDSELMNGRNHIAIFIDAPSRVERENRIRNRGILPEEEIIDRIATGDEELRFYEENKDYFDHYIINDDLDQAVKQVLGIIMKQ